MNQITQFDRQTYYDSLGIKGIPCIDHEKRGNNHGYAEVYYAPLKRCVLMHRLVLCGSLNLRLEEIKGKIVMHLCDNPRCIEPKHLKLGTHKDNMLDKRMKGRGSNQFIIKDKLEYLYKRYITD